MKKLLIFFTITIVSFLACTKSPSSPVFDNPLDPEAENYVSVEFRNLSVPMQDTINSGFTISAEVWDTTHQIKFIKVDGYRTIDSAEVLSKLFPFSVDLADSWKQLSYDDTISKISGRIGLRLTALTDTVEGAYQFKSNSVEIDIHPLITSSVNVVEVIKGDTARLEVDGFGSIAKYLWNWNDYDTNSNSISVVETTTTNSLNIQLSPIAINSIVSVSGIDSSNLYSNELTFNVKVNNGEPTVNSLTIDNNTNDTVIVDNPMLFKGNASDIDGSVESYHWIIKKNNTVIVKDTITTENQIYWTPDTTNIFTISLSVIDNDNKVSLSTKSKIFVVTPNFNAPKLLSPLDSATSQNNISDSVTFTWSNSALDNSNIIYIFYLYNDNYSSDLYTPADNNPDTVTTTSFTTELDSAQSYRWGVVALDTVKHITLSSQAFKVTGRQYSKVEVLSSQLKSLSNSLHTNLEPSLNSNIHKYEMFIPEIATEVILSAVPEGSLATVTINGDSVSAPEYTSSLTLLGDTTSVEIKTTSYGQAPTFPKEEETITVLLIKEGVPTLVSGEVSADKTFAFANSPYKLKDNVYIKTGVVATVEPGVRFIMADKAALIIDGTLLANGTDGQPITVNPENDSSSWKYFKFTDNSINSNISYCNFNKGGFLEASEESATIITNKTELIINNCNISSSLSNGILYTASTGNITIAKLNVFNSFQSGARISLPTLGDPIKLSILQSNFSNNGDNGILLMGKIDSVIINNSTMSSNNINGINSNYESTITEYNNIYKSNKKTASMITSGKHLTILGNRYESNGETASMGGAIYIYNVDTISVDSSKFINNNSTDTAGAIYVFSPSTKIFTVNNSTFSGNYGANSSSAIQADMANSEIISIKNSLFNDLSNHSKNLILIKHYKDTTVTITDNNIYCGGETYAIKTEATSDKGPINANNNFWGATTPDFSKLIYDFYKSDTVSKVDRATFSTTPIVGTPDK